MKIPNKLNVKYKFNTFLTIVCILYDFVTHHQFFLCVYLCVFWVISTCSLPPHIVTSLELCSINVLKSLCFSSLFIPFSNSFKLKFLTKSKGIINLPLVSMFAANNTAIKSLQSNIIFSFIVSPLFEGRGKPTSLSFLITAFSIFTP